MFERFLMWFRKIIVKIDFEKWKLCGIMILWKKECSLWFCGSWYINVDTLFGSCLNKIFYIKSERVFVLFRFYLYISHLMPFKIVIITFEFLQLLTLSTLPFANFYLILMNPMILFLNMLFCCPQPQTFF